MATTTIGASAAINETASTAVLAADTRRVSVIMTNLSTADYWLARGTAAVIGQGVLLAPNIPIYATSDPSETTGEDATILNLSWNVIADTGAGAGLGLAYEVIQR